MRALLAFLPFNATACSMAVLICIGCKVEQTTTPSSVSVDILQPIESTGVDTGGTPPDPTQPREPGDVVSLVFDPPSITGSAPSSVVVKVIALDQAGDEVRSVDLTVRMTDPLVASVKGIDGRFVSFSLKSTGTTTAVITAAGAQGALPITVN